MGESGALPGAGRPRFALSELISESEVNATDCKHFWIGRTWASWVWPRFPWWFRTDLFEQCLGWTWLDWATVWADRFTCCCLTSGRLLRLGIYSPIPHLTIQNTLLRTKICSLKTHPFENKSQWLFRVPDPAVLPVKLRKLPQKFGRIKISDHTPKKYRGLHTSCPNFVFFLVS